jgi:L-2-hydroxyglutarate oxidase LhgO
MLRRRAVALATQWRAAQSVAAASLSSASCCTYSSALEEQLDTVDCVVVGAGVVGLACARAAALAGREVVLLEAAPTWGTVTSSRHSEVIHAGIYYPPGSLKAALCVEGRQLLYEYCVRRGVAHAQLGKLIVATSEQ